ncbi:hypothetical protein SAMN02745157_1414 [Kaistia soli DSM 19436]|uniref:Uncharacterized protein n=1 Tax=Kaistia soli DSM 19436 TaxID=1122133 RepID=A0A1M4Y3R3_9HYPH|nr:hypothetical protein [Kaistia soli]SHF00345.1 hypothetical protein SAMN02745157_1414 [Kaistia soli DSM 19436]
MTMEPAETHPGTEDEMLHSMRRRIDILHLDLSKLQVVTEAATGAYAATAVIAAMAGAEVHACARDTVHHGSARDAIDATRRLARLAGVETRISFSIGVSTAALNSCSILTNSGRLRPITRDVIRFLPREAVIALMFEAWEFRGTDFDLPACRENGIRIAAVNERHPDVAVFPFLGPLCVRLLRDGDMNVDGKRIAVLCDNPFAEFLIEGLREAGATAELFNDITPMREDSWDAVVLSMTPRDRPLGRASMDMIARRAPGALLAQFWGDIDRAAARVASLRVWPLTEPGQGHMGILLNRLGPEPIIRLQAGSLKAAEMVFRGEPLPADGVASLL